VARDEVGRRRVRSVPRARRRSQPRPAATLPNSTSGRVGSWAGAVGVLASEEGVDPNSALEEWARQDPSRRLIRSSLRARSARPASAVERGQPPARGTRPGRPDRCPGPRQRGPETSREKRCSLGRTSRRWGWLCRTPGSSSPLLTSFRHPACRNDHRPGPYSLAEASPRSVLSVRTNRLTHACEIILRDTRVSRGEPAGERKAVPRVRRAEWAN
jgi:hypothetical protein